MTDAALTLSLLHRSQRLVAALTDGKGLARVDWADQPTDPSVPDGLVMAGRQDLSAEDLCARGARLYDLLPAAIRSLLRTIPDAAVTLQMDPAFEALPWELAFDGEHFLGEKFGLARQRIVEGAAPPRRNRPVCPDLLNVLVLGVDPGVQPEPGLLAALRTVDGVTVHFTPVDGLAADAVAARVAEADIVHGWAWDSGLSGGPLSDAARTGQPHLIVLPSAAHGPDPRVGAATLACALGINVLACGAGAPADGQALLLAVYRRLVDGTALGEAVRASRAALHERHGIVRAAAAGAVLHGDPSTVVRAQGRRTRTDDSRRQVTILSLDLVESTRLLAEIGAERYSEVLAEYHRRCAAVLQARGGAPDDPQGDDGMMCYFGFPEAREDAGAQAVYAGLELIEAVQSLGLRVRVGVCTGDVVVRAGQPVGSAIHYAARLQSIAAPGTMVVGESTRRIVRGGVRFEPLPYAAHLKGFAATEPLYRAAASQTASQAIWSPPERRLTPFIGRERELEALQDYLAAAQAGRLQFVRVKGEAGIGKSRLLREFRRALSERGHQVFECRCAPEHANNALHPIVEWLRSELLIRPGDETVSAQFGLERLVAPSASLDDGALALLADLLGIPTQRRHPVLDQSPERRRQLTVEMLTTLMRQRLQGLAACMVVEDAHWIDPSTGEFLNHLAAVAQDERLLVLLTMRADGAAAWRVRPRVHELVLGGLSPAQSRALVLAASSSAGAGLPTATVHALAARADGVPLFIEESTRMAIELAQAGEAASDLGQVPTTLLDLLTARLDRLGPAKMVAQAAGTIGREFPIALLRAVLDHPDSPLPTLAIDAGLDALVEADLLLVQRDATLARCAFRHMLVRDAAYHSLLERDRVRLHRVVAHVLTERFPQLVEHQPAMLAQHHGEAGNHAEALRGWERAARQAASRSAHAEAIGYLGQALASLPHVPDGAGRDQVELRLQLLLATRLIATEGYGAVHVERAYARALELAAALDDKPALTKIQLGLEGYHFMRADFAKARAYALDAARNAPLAGPVQVVQAQWALAIVRMHQGDMPAAVRDMDACRAAHDRLEHRPAAVQDPGVMCLCYSAWSLWQLGRPDEALRRVMAVVDLAERMRHPFSLGEALGFRAAVQHFRGENAAALASAERAIRVCEEGGFLVWLAHARLMRGRIVAELGDPATGSSEMRSAYEAWAATGAVVTTPFYLAMRAEGLALGGRAAEALSLVQEAMAIVERCGERYYEPEIRRLHGALMLQAAAAGGPERSAEAERWLQGALDCARAGRMRSLALRSAMDLVDLRLAQGRAGAAVEILAPACAAIREGRGTRDLVRAQALLARARRTPERA